MYTDKIVPVTPDTFQAEVLDFDQLVLVDFWGTNCGPCKMIAPKLNEYAADYEGVVKFVSVNCEDHPELVQSQGIRMMPTFQVYRNGQRVHECFGMGGFMKLKNTLDDLLRA